MTRVSLRSCKNRCRGFLSIEGLTRYEDKKQQTENLRSTGLTKALLDAERTNYWSTLLSSTTAMSADEEEQHRADEEHKRSTVSTSDPAVDDGETQHISDDLYESLLNRFDVSSDQGREVMQDELQKKHGFSKGSTVYKAVVARFNSSTD